MNLRQYSIALLISALPVAAIANSHGVQLGPSDFVSAEKQLENGESIVSFKLSKSGRSKLKKLEAQASTNRILAGMAGTGTEPKL